MLCATVLRHFGQGRIAPPRRFIRLDGLSSKSTTVLCQEGVPQMQSNPKPVNIQHRVESRAGWIAWFSGESQGRALERALPELNALGYKVAFVIPDRWNPFRFLLNSLLFIVTLGFYAKSQNLLIIGELMSEDGGDGQ